MATTTVPPKEGTATMPDVEEPESNAIEQENATSSRITSTARAILNRTLSAAKDVSIDDGE
ncbi:unnamed protein product [Nippostrongylus brasiliensis]|uniref:Uncharacterized protein n=1 Tax=Nippostrongylus brasiliensis TaxID=27835 RepID=A0A0N4XR93_NIPBR|nr:unnamed protein product [Nippostrongylus brasiliensis]